MDKLLIKEIYLPIIYITIGYILYKFILWIINLALSKKQHNLNKNSYNYKKIETFKNLLKNILKILVLLFIVLSILPVYDVDVSSLLAGLGIVSAVFALAFQDILKDLIGGVSIILEDQFALGDIIEIGGFKGEVIEMGLKTTRIQHYEGKVKIIANRNITDVINYSCSYSLAIVDVAISYEDNIEKVEKVLQELANELSQELTKLKDKIEVLGIQSIDSSSIKYRMTVKTATQENFRIEREIKKAIKLRFDKKGIKIPYPQIEVHNGK